jgi:hypothetical protein
MWLSVMSARWQSLVRCHSRHDGLLPDECSSSRLPHSHRHAYVCDRWFWGLTADGFPFCFAPCETERTVQPLVEEGLLSESGSSTKVYCRGGDRESSSFSSQSRRGIAVGSSFGCILVLLVSHYCLFYVYLLCG